MLRGIDVSSNNSVDVAAIDCDFCVVKATEGTAYVNERFDYQVDRTITSGKKLGIYHYAFGNHSPGSVEEEVAHFLEWFRPYIGRAIPMLDWEAEALSLPVSWAREWMEAVERETGTTPFFYAGGSYINYTDCSEIARFPLWMCSYLPRYDHTDFVDDPLNTWALGAWERMTMYQYTGNGRVDGYGGDLDLNVFYGTREDWDRMLGGSTPGRIEKMVGHAIAIAEDDSHGYSQADRWDVDRDCSSLMYESADLAGYPVGHGPDATRYTGTMLADFTAAGFTAIPFSEVGLDGLKRGDILLNVVHHTEMCIGNGQFVGAHGSETGGAYGQPGDQTGQEISIVPAYVYWDGWDWVLRPPHETSYESEDDMAFIYQPDGKPVLRLHTGNMNVQFEHPDQKDAVIMAYEKAMGRKLPVIELGSEEAPWGARFEQCFPFYIAGDKDDLSKHAKLQK